MSGTEWTDEWLPEFRVRGLPADDWPGLPGIDWGMGSRVDVKIGSDIARGALVVGAVEAPVVGGWVIYCRLASGDHVCAFPVDVSAAR